MPDAVGSRDGVRPDRRHDRIAAIVETVAPGATMSRRPCLYATSYRLEEIEVRRPGHPDLRLMAKHVGRRAMTEAGHQAKSRASDCAERELAVYRDLLAGAGLGTPALVGGYAGRGEGALVLERIEGDPLTEIGDFGVWMAAARWLARMHARFTDTLAPIDLRGPRPPLVRYQRGLLAAEGQRGLQRASDRGLGSKRLRSSLARAHERALDVLTSARPTLVHGDFYPSNIVVVEERIAVVDWELAGTGSGQLDLAALVAGRWDDEHRGHLVQAYYDQATAIGPTEPYSVLMNHLMLASLHIALRWLGSAPEWEAPAEHHRDWFADAVTVLGHIDAGVV